MIYLISYKLSDDKLITLHGKEIVKLGFSNSWKSRLQTYKYNLPLPVKIFFEVEGSFDEEQRIHRLLSSHQANGEWYYKSDTLFGDIDFLLGSKPVLQSVVSSPPPVEESVIFKFISWINTMGENDVYDLNTFLESIPKKQVGTIKNHLLRDTSKPTKHLRAMGIVRRANRKTGTTFFYES